MASKRAERRRACTSKRKYASQTEAVKVIIGRQRDGVHGLHSYRCPWCGGWHIGHLPHYKRVIMGVQFQRA